MTKRKTKRLTTKQQKAKPMITTKHIFLATTSALVLGALTLSGFLVETNDAGYVQVKQEAATGHMSVRTDPGVYAQMFSAIHTYKISDVYDFNDDQIDVRFGDSATAKVSGQAKFRLPSNPEAILRIHQDFRSFYALENDLIKQTINAAIIQTATLFDADEVYSTRRADFIRLINEQIKAGLYVTSYTEVLKKDENGNSFIQRSVAPKLNAEGKPYISEKSAFDIYGIELIQLVINDIDFDSITDQLIAKRKEAEQEQVVAKATAERAKQDAITVMEQGKASVAKAEADALVAKKTAVIKAEEEKEVAEQQALKAEEEKKAIIAKGEAEAESSRLKVAAGLSPLEKANIDKETAIGVARELSNVKFPGMMVIGGGESSPMNPFDAVGLKSFIDISKQLAEGDK